MNNDLHRLRYGARGLLLCTLRPREKTGCAAPNSLINRPMSASAALSPGVRMARGGGFPPARRRIERRVGNRRGASDDSVG